MRASWLDEARGCYGKAMLLGYRTLYHVGLACVKTQKFMVPKVVSLSTLILVSDVSQSNIIENLRFPHHLETSL